MVVGPLMAGGAIALERVQRIVADHPAMDAGVIPLGHGQSFYGRAASPAARDKHQIGRSGQRSQRQLGPRFERGPCADGFCERTSLPAFVQEPHLQPATGTPADGLPARCKISCDRPENKSRLSGDGSTGRPKTQATERSLWPDCNGSIICLLGFWARSIWQHSASGRG